MGTEVQAPESQALVVQSDRVGAAASIMNPRNMEQMMAFAKVMATGRISVPAELRNEGDCLALTMQAMMWGMNPFAVAQKCHVISGKLGYEAQLVNAVINSSGVTLDRMHFEWFGPWEKILGKFVERESKSKKDDAGYPVKFRVPGWKAEDEQGCGVRAFATLRGEREPRELVLLMTQARTRNSTLWADDPRQQLAYLAQKRWCRLYAPDVLLGVYTVDELQERDMGDAEVVRAEPEKKREPAKPEYPAESFEKNLPAWRDLIESGKRTAEQIIAMVSSRAMLTADQVKRLRFIEERPAYSEILLPDHEMQQEKRETGVPTPEEQAEIHRREMEEMGGQA